MWWVILKYLLCIPSEAFLSNRYHLKYNLFHFLLVVLLSEALVYFLLELCKGRLGENSNHVNGVMDPGTIFTAVTLQDIKQSPAR